MKTLRSGYITSAGMDGGRLRLTIDDSYEDDALHLDIWLGRTIARKTPRFSTKNGAFCH